MFLIYTSPSAAATAVIAVPPPLSPDVRVITPIGCRDLVMSALPSADAVERVEQHEPTLDLAQALEEILRCLVLYLPCRTRCASRVPTIALHLGYCVDSRCQQ